MRSEAEGGSVLKGIQSTPVQSNIQEDSQAQAQAQAKKNPDYIRKHKEAGRSPQVAVSPDPFSASPAAHYYLPNLSISIRIHTYCAAFGCRHGKQDTFGYGYVRNDTGWTRKERRYNKSQKMDGDGEIKFALLREMHYDSYMDRRMGS
ncbi:hypothetical protein BYT27DRAFT_7207348 [Phlegmacium glaucopus]|nr:hypothetical protein BYT27DRAFT_7207348 [Phlegmacium glaucopus]